MKKKFMAITSFLVMSAIGASQQQVVYGQIISPANNSFLTAGANQEISWRINDDSTSIVVLQYSTDAGYNWDCIASSGIAAGSYDWIIPATVNSYLCKVRIVKFTGRGETLIASSGIFSIAILDPWWSTNEVFSHRVIALTDTVKHHPHRTPVYR